MRILISVLSFLLFVVSAVAPAAASGDVITLHYRERPTATNGYTVKYGPPHASVRLAGVAIPENPEAMDYMNSLFKQTYAYPMTISLLEAPSSRYSTPYAEIMTGQSDISLQRELIISGLVRFFPFGLDKNSPMIKELEQAEAFARETKKGLWAKPMTVLAADNPYMMRADNKLALVKGTIVSASVNGKYTYINFGADPKTDFTVMIPAEAWAEFTEEERTKLQTAATEILIRGTMSSYNGPMIMIKHPAQIEFIEK